MNSNVGLRIKQLRQEKKITQAKLAKELGVSQPMINQYENSDTLPMETLNRIAVAMSLSVKELANPDDLENMQGKEDFLMHEKKRLLRKEIDTYIHFFDDDPKISRNGKLGKLVYGSDFQEFMATLLNVLCANEDKQSAILKRLDSILRLAPSDMADVLLQNLILDGIFSLDDNDKGSVIAHIGNILAGKGNNTEKAKRG